MDAQYPPTDVLSRLSASFGVLLPLKNTEYANSNAPKRHRSSPLLQAIYFSRSFIPTLYICIAVVVVLASATHFYTRWNKRRQLNRRLCEGKSNTPSSSSSSSTINQNNVITIKDGFATEQTRLLGRQHSGAAPSFFSRLSSRVQAFFMYEPKAIPAITAPSNHLPSNGTSFLVIAFFLLNLFYLFYGLKLSLMMVFALADRAGLCFVVNLPILYFLGAKNNQPLKWLTGWSYEKVNLFHRRLGEWMIFLGVLHGIGMLMTFYNLFKPLGYSLGWFLTLPVIIFGNTALLSFLIIWITSIGNVREKAYEFFLVTHIGFQTAALVLLFLHHSGARVYCGVAIAVWILDRGVSRILLSAKKFIATLEIAEDKTTVLLYCDIPLNRSKRCDIRSGWKAGQHVFLSIPSMGWHQGFQAHPFTIASPAPPADMDGKAWPLQLIIRCKDGFSKELLEFAEFHQHVEVRLDGPYGSSDLEEAVLAAERVCLIAGGSGISVTYPLAWSLCATGGEASVVSSRTVYHHGKKTKSNILLHSAPGQNSQAHFWIRQSPEHSSWITMFPSDRADTLAGSQTSHCSNAVDLVSRTFETRQDAYASRPHVPTEMRSWLEETNLNFDRRTRICVVVSGPDSLVRDVRNCAAAMVREGYNIELHEEKFGW